MQNLWNIRSLPVHFLPYAVLDDWSAIAFRTNNSAGGGKWAKKRSVFFFISKNNDVLEAWPSARLSHILWTKIVATTVTQESDELPGCTPFNEGQQNKQTNKQTNKTTTTKTATTTTKSKQKPWAGVELSTPRLNAQCSTDWASDLVRQRARVFVGVIVTDLVAQWRQVGLVALVNDLQLAHAVQVAAQVWRQQVLFLLDHAQHFLGVVEELVTLASLFQKLQRKGRMKSTLRCKPDEYSSPCRTWIRRRWERIWGTLVWSQISCALMHSHILRTSSKFQVS